MQETQHIQRAFDRDLEQIQSSIMKMGGLVETAIIDASISLQERDEDLAQRVRTRDKDIDVLEMEVNEAAALLIALRAPTASDLRTVLAVMKISGKLERCGDYAKNMAKRTIALVQLQPPEGAASSIRRLTREVRGMLKDALDAYIQRDADLAEEVRQRDHEIDQMYNAAFRELLNYMLEDPRNITACMHMHFIAKNIERMGDHVTSIADQVIYLVTGEMPEESRPKGDRTAFISTEVGQG